ncbi:MAG: glucose-6-phosphate dehydrogenase [Alphaproteobacteria bacterium]|nr:glucose-6-phosphate dehydrogenase [Alphaproteobacteria bacterium]MCB9696782.1 glucose-6-phosphate dehydrogenase [Alphaproteobacteria bacterium]
MANPAQIVIFGASGDLTARKLIPALLGNVAVGALSPDAVQVIGVSRSARTSEQWREDLAAWVPVELAEAWPSFVPCLHYVTADASVPEQLERLHQELDRLAEPMGGESKVGRLFYLALAPELFGPVVGCLAGRGMTECPVDAADGWRRVVIEKPFGVDLPSAQALNRELLRWLREEQIYRIDHYLGKETVQNLLTLRFQNAIFEPLWNRNHVESVEISVLETVAMEGRRGAYYDGAGALRDMVQNHLMQILALVAMEPPGSLSAAAVRGEKIKVVGSLRRFTPKEVATHVVRGQYVAGPSRDQAYRQEIGVAPRSRTETYVAARVLVDNWRWSGVPFLLRTGKALHRASTEVLLRFRTPPVDLLNGPVSPDVCRLRPNTLRILIQPEEGVRLSFLVKEPGAGMRMRSSELGFDYGDLGSDRTPPAYQRLLLDAIEGNATLFIHKDEVEGSWAFADAIRAGWEEADPPVHRYPAGSHGPEAADALWHGCEGGWS